MYLDVYYVITMIIVLLLMINVIDVVTNVGIIIKIQQKIIFKIDMLSKMSIYG